MESSFIYREAEFLNLGLTPSAYWIRLNLAFEYKSVYNQISGQPEENLYLSLGSRNITKADLYYPNPNMAPGNINDEKYWLVQEGGYAKELNQGESVFSNCIFEIPVYHDSIPRNLFLRVESEASLFLPLTISTRAYLEKNQYILNMLLGLYYGIALALFFYNIFIYFSLRERYRLYYIFSILFMMVYAFALNRFTIDFIIKSDPDWNRWLLFAALGLFMAATVLFTKSYLEIGKQNPVLNIILYLLIGASLLVSAGTFFLDHYAVNSFSALLGLIIPAVSLFAGLIRLIRGFRPARYFMLAFSFQFLLIPIYALAMMNVIPFYPPFMYVFQTGTALQVIFLSFAQADRIREIRTKLNHAQKEMEQALKRLSEINNELQVYNQLLAAV